MKMTNDEELKKPRNNRNLEGLAKKIKPIMWSKVDYDNGRERVLPFYVRMNEGEKTNTRGESRKPGERAYGLEKMKEIDTYYHVLGSPVLDITLNRVLPQIPEDCIDEVVAVEVHEPDWYNGYNWAVARVALYCQNKQKYAFEVNEEIKRMEQQRRELAQKCSTLRKAIKKEKKR